MILKKCNSLNKELMIMPNTKASFIPIGHNAMQYVLNGVQKL